MWKWQFVKDFDISLWYIVLLTTIGVGVVYAIDFIYRKIEKVSRCFYDHASYSCFHGKTVAQSFYPSKESQVYVCFR